MKSSEEFKYKGIEKFSIPPNSLKDELPRNTHSTIFMGNYFHQAHFHRLESAVYILKREILRQFLNLSTSWKRFSITGTFTLPIVFSWWLKKHCQRHNGPEDWVHIASYTNLDQTISKFWLSIYFQISTKHQHFD